LTREEVACSLIVDLLSVRIADIKLILLRPRDGELAESRGGYN
jgi:hypothetical protein